MCKLIILVYGFNEYMYIPCSLSPVAKLSAFLPRLFILVRTEFALPEMKKLLEELVCVKYELWFIQWGNFPTCILSIQQ